MKRTLRLNKETLTELSPDTLAAVVGGPAITHNGCTLPINQCVLSLNPCYSDDACGTGTGATVIVISGGC